MQSKIDLLVPETLKSIVLDSYVESDLDTCSIQCALVESNIESWDIENSWSRYNFARIDGIHYFHGLGTAQFHGIASNRGRQCLYTPFRPSGRRWSTQIEDSSIIADARAITRSPEFDILVTKSRMSFLTLWLESWPLRGESLKFTDLYLWNSVR